MLVLPGTKSLWDSTLNDVNEALRSQLDFDYYLAILTGAVACLSLAPFTVLGNVLVICTFWKDPNNNLRAAPSNILLASLALSDFFVGAFQSPLTVYYWIASVANEHSPFSFTFLFSVNAFVAIVSILHLLALSVDRFIAVVTPLRYASTVTKRRTHIAAACIWFYSLIIGCTRAALTTIATSGTLIALHVVIPWLCLTFLNARIIYTMRKASTSLRANVIEEQMTIFEKRERKVVKLVLLILGVFVLCYLPWFISFTLALSCPVCDLRVLMYSYGISGVLLYISPLVHPFLYAWRLPKFRNAFLCYLKFRTVSDIEDMNIKIKDQSLSLDFTTQEVQRTHLDKQSVNISASDYASRVTCA